MSCQTSIIPKGYFPNDNRKTHYRNATVSLRKEKKKKQDEKFNNCCFDLKKKASPGWN